jgi:molybdenum cofactor cytidylyltransferase
MVAAVVLAAGKSSRMGSPKALLRTPDGYLFVARIVVSFVAAGVTNVTVVTGADHDSIVRAIASDPPQPLPTYVRNADPSRGQLSSLWAGMDAAVGADTEVLLVTLVDVPMVETRTIARLLDVWNQTRAPIVRPVIGDRHGHPVLFARSLFGELRTAPLDEGAKAVMRRHADRIVNVPVDDEGCLVDVDTPADLDALRRRFDS